MDKNKKRNILKKLGIKKKQFFLVTIHRQENVDDKKRFEEILKGLQIIYAKTLNFLLFQHESLYLRPKPVLCVIVLEML